MKHEFERVADIKRLNFIIESINSSLPHNATVLDVGCGNGIITRSLGKKGFKVLGIDISEKAIANARALNHMDNIDFQVMSAEQLVVSKQQYDAVVCSEVLEHLHEPQQLLQVLHQSLKDDGILIVTVPNGKGPRETLVTKPVQLLQQKDNKLWKWIQKLKQRLGYKGVTVQSSADNLTHVQFFTKSSLEQLARNGHFKVVRFGKTNFLEDVFPFSFFTKRIKFLQKLDCAIADVLPYSLNGGFVTVWKKS